MVFVYLRLSKSAEARSFLRIRPDVISCRSSVDGRQREVKARCIEDEYFDFLHQVLMVNWTLPNV